MDLVKKQKPLLCVFIYCHDELNDKYLVQFRKKQPFMNYLGTPGGKVDYGNTVEQQARIELLEETGLTADLELKTITNTITKDSETGEVKHHMIGFIFRGTNMKGKLIKENREGINQYLSIEEVKQYKRFADQDPHLKIIAQNKKEISYVTTQRTTKGTELIKAQILTDQF